MILRLKKYWFLPSAQFILKDGNSQELIKVKGRILCADERH